MGKLTIRGIETAGARDKPYKLVDGEGLQLRIGTDGRKTWLVRYVVDKKTRQYSLPKPYRSNGGAGHISLQDARDAARDIRALARQGIDYQLQLEQEKLKRAAAEAADLTAKAEAERAQAAQHARLTVTQLLDRWQRVELNNRKDGGKEVRRSFEKDVLPVLGHVAVEDVTRSMVAGILDAVVERGSPVIARNLLSTMRQMFTFAIKRELIEVDPTAILRRDDYGKRNERERVLSAAEIKELVRKLPEAKLQESTEIAIWLMLSTCCRVGELSKARWIDIDMDAATWRIPGEHTKNGKEHIVLLSDFSVRQFQTLRTINNKSSWCFPAERKPDSHLCIKAISKQIHDRQRTASLKNRSKATGVLLLAGGPWTPHDLRRTGATVMGTLGVRPDVIEKCLNHVEQNKLVRIYQRQKLKPEQRDAWRVLGDRLQLLMTGSDNVITLPRAA